MLLADDQWPIAKPVSIDTLTVKIDDLKDDGRLLDAEKARFVALRSRFVTPGRRENILGIYVKLTLTNVGH